LTTNHKIIFAPGNNEPEFIAGMCHWLLVMGTQRSRSIEQSPFTSTPIKEMDSAAIAQGRDIYMNVKPLYSGQQ